MGQVWDVFVDAEDARGGAQSANYAVAEIQGNGVFGTIWAFLS